MNIVILTGRLTKDPEVRFGQSGNAFCKFTLAVDRIVKDGENSADFINCTAFGKTAEFIGKYFNKGKKMALNGSINTGSYEKNGEKVYTTQVLVNSVEFADGKAEGKPNGENVYNYAPSTKAEPAGEAFVPNDLIDEEISEDDFPF